MLSLTMQRTLLWTASHQTTHGHLCFDMFSHITSLLSFTVWSPDAWLVTCMAALEAASACCTQARTHTQAESASLLVMQDMDVETLMQEIKQWGPQDQDQAPRVQDQTPQEDAIVNEAESQSPGRLSLDKTDQPSSSSMQVDTPDHSQNQEEEEEASSSSDKASLQTYRSWSLHCDLQKPGTLPAKANHVSCFNVPHVMRSCLFGPSWLCSISSMMHQHARRSLSLEATPVIYGMLHCDARC